MVEKHNTKNNRQNIVVVVGPTASGKSDLGIKLAQKIRGEIISADSRQVYRGMNLGTGKVPKDSFRNFQFSIFNFQSNSKSKTPKKDYYFRGIKHHLIDVVSPKKQFTASDFKQLGEKAIKEIRSKGKIPMIVGGTGFYIDVLLGRISAAPVPPNPKLRAQFDKLTAEKLFEKLQKKDSDRAKTIDRHNKRRLIRALEIINAINRESSSASPKRSREWTILSESKQVNNWDNIIWIGLNPENLKERIKKRLDSRLKQDIVKEVELLYKHGVSWKRLDDLGLEYRWISRYLMQKSKIKNQNDNLKFKNSEEYKNLLRDIQRYSKRQMTWFKRNKEIHWIKNLKEVMEITRKELV